MRIQDTMTDAPIATATSTGNLREVDVLRTVNSSEPLTPTGPSGSQVGEIPTPMETASLKKLSSVLLSLGPGGESTLLPSKANKELHGTRQVQLSGLRAGALSMKCPDCESELQFCERCEGRHGLVIYMSFQCTTCIWHACITDPGAPSTHVALF